MDDDQTRLPDEGPKSSLLSEGQTFGQYKVIRLLGRGGMGEVYEVAHTVLHRRYALKVIRPEVLSRPSAVERFRREAQVMNHLEHPNIVQVDEYGETDGHTWLRMQLIGGGAADENGEERMANGESSLADLLTGEPLPEALVVDLISQILGGLAYAHSKGAIHRDIKPSNILLEVNRDFNTAPTREEAEAKFSPSSASKKTKLSVNLAKLSGKKITAKIADFGLVHMAGEDWVQSQVKLTVARSQMDPEATRLDGEGQMANGGSQAGTSTQALLGTFEYMAPEQKRGEPADERSDLYAVGLIAFRMLTGHEAPGFELPSELVPGLNPAWDQWIKQALAHDKNRRVESAQAMLDTLPSNESGKPASDTPETVKEPKRSKENIPPKKASRSIRVLVVIGLVPVLAVLVVIGLRSIQIKEGGQKTEQEKWWEDTQTLDQSEKQRQEAARVERELEARAEEETKVALTTNIPPKLIEGAPKPIKVPNLEPALTSEPVLKVPEGTALLSAGKPVTSSDNFPIIGNLGYITDGVKKAGVGSFVELYNDLQWVQIDLGAPAKLSAIWIWHYHSQRRAYHDVIVQVSNEPSFNRGVTTLFNNDFDNSSGMGKGSDRPYVESHFGKLIDAKGTAARYVRLYSNGNTTNDMNHYTEVEVFGIAR